MVQPAPACRAAAVADVRVPEGRRTRLERLEVDAAVHADGRARERAARAQGLRARRAAREPERDEPVRRDHAAVDADPLGGAAAVAPFVAIAAVPAADELDERPAKKELRSTAQE